MKKKLFLLSLFMLFATLFFINVYPPHVPASRMVMQAHAVSGEKYVFLTFDDGPTDSTTPKVLDVLKDEGVKATFFVIGRQAERREKLLRRIVAEGHAVGIHTYSHEYSKIYASPSALLEDAKKCRDVIRDITGVDTRLYRFPGGSFSVPKACLRAVEEEGYDWVDWNVSARDSEGVKYTATELYKHAVKDTGELGYVTVLMHDGAGHDNTVCALRSLIKFYKEKGYRFGTL